MRGHLVLGRIIRGHNFGLVFPDIAVSCQAEFCQLIWGQPTVTEVNVQR